MAAPRPTVRVVATGGSIAGVGPHRYAYGGAAGSLVQAAHQHGAAGLGLVGFGCLV